MKELITIENYEAFLLDAMEGNLSAESRNQLLNFLDQHPELGIDLDDLELEELIEEDIQLDHKKNLFRDEETGLTEEEYLMISSVEKTIKSDELQELKKLAESKKGFLKEMNRYEQTKITALEVAYPYKSDLLKRESSIIPWYVYSSVAASLLLLLWIGNSFESATYEYRLVSLNSTEISNGANSILSNLTIKEQKPPTNQKAKTPLIRKSQAQINLATNANIEQEEGQIDQEEEESLLPIEIVASVESDSISSQEIEVIDKVDSEIAQMEHLDQVGKDQTEPINSANNFVPITTFAKEKLKKEVLKNKTFTEVLAEEITEATNEKIVIEAVSAKSGKLEQFALNIGKFSFSRK